jgi:hypothetical protein
MITADWIPGLEAFARAFDTANSFGVTYNCQSKLFTISIRFQNNHLCIGQSRNLQQALDGMYEAMEVMAAELDKEIKL